MARPGNRSFQPSVTLLEDRTCPSGFRAVTAGPATHLMVIAPKEVTAGQAFTIEVEALDSANRVSAGFTGPVQLSLGTADPGATLPGYTFTTADHGVHFFQVTLTLAGTQKIVAAGGKITGTAPTAVKPGAATHFQVTAVSGAVGAVTSVTVAALDAENNVVTSFTGAVTLSASNSNLPPSYAFVAADHGMHTFNVAFTLAGSETVSATAGSNAAMTGSTTIVVAAPTSQGYYGDPSYYYGTDYYETPGYYGAGYYGNLGYYGTGYYGNLGYYGIPASYAAGPTNYGGLGYYGTGWNTLGTSLNG